MPHTPGPWESRHDDTAICKGEMTLARVYWGEGRSHAENISNAKLIAVAPEMRELLLEAAEFFNDSESSPGNEWFRRCFLITGDHMILTYYGWVPGSGKAKYIESGRENEIKDEINAPISITP